MSSHSIERAFQEWNTKVEARVVQALNDDFNKRTLDKIKNISVKAPVDRKLHITTSDAVERKAELAKQELIRSMRLSAAIHLSMMPEFRTCPSLPSSIPLESSVASRAIQNKNCQQLKNNPTTDSCSS